MNKKGLGFNEVVGVILAIAFLFVFILYPGSKLYASITKQQYVDSYNNLVATIENIADSTEQTQDSTDLMIDEKSAIFTIAKEAERVEFLAHQTVMEYFEKPSQCEEKACICLCQEIDKENLRIICKKKRCNIFDNVDFIGLEKENFRLDSSGVGGIVPDYKLENGLMFRRGKRGRSLFYTPYLERKSATIYLQKIDNNIVFCFEKSPCIEKNE